MRKINRVPQLTPRLIRSALKRPLARYICFLAVLPLLAAATIRSQQKPDISVEVKVVTVLATVHDKKGQIVSNLGKDDFKLDEDGRPQTITYFGRESDLPLTLGLLVDTSESQRRVLDDERTASYSFLDELLRENQIKDQAFVIHFDKEVELLQDLTSSREKLEHSLGELNAPQLIRQGSGGGNGRGNGGGDNGGIGGGGRGGQRPRFGLGAGTLLYDAIFLASDEVIKKQQGRKALIVLSDGVDHGSKETLESAIMTAQRADTVVYSILFADERQNPGGFTFGGPGFSGRRGGGGGGGGGRRFPQEQEHPDGKKVLERMSRETGGRMFEVSKKQTVGDIFRAISEELRNQYSLGYTPEKTDAAPGYRKIHLAAKQKDLTVQARDGYYASR